MPSLIKIFALFFAAVIFAAVFNSKSAFAQHRSVANFGIRNGSFHGRLVSRKTAGLAISGTLMVGSTEDLIAAVATSDQML
jgi:hypothetical protein